MPASLTPEELIAARQALSRDAMDGLLLDGVPLAAIAARAGTPAYVFAADTLALRARQLKAAMPGIAIHYAVKANDHLAVLRDIAGFGFGADVVSGGELARAMAAGFPASRIVFSGVGKTQAEMQAALDAGIGQMNVESAEELEELNQIAAARGLRAPVALRVNPDIDARTHDKISTGRAGDKFGVPYEQVEDLYARGAAMPGIRMRGLAVHIGSQLFSAVPFVRAYARLASLVAAIRARGLEVEVVDCGGGLGVQYGREAAMMPQAWAGAIRAGLGEIASGPNPVQVAIEPGRWLVAPCGVLLSRVVRVRREGLDRPMVVLDAAMNDLLRPAMYAAYHGIVPVLPHDLVAPPASCDVVGPVCESSDVFARERMLPALQRGALVALLDAGAYGAVMASTYNARPLAAQVMVRGGEGFIIRARQDIADLWQADVLPPLPAALEAG